MMHENLTFRIDDLGDLGRRRAWGDLLRDIFDADFTTFLALDIWPSDYRGFSYMDGDIIAANVSLEPFPLMIAHKQVKAGQIQSVATRPPYRGRGLFRELMQHMLAFADKQYECLFLTTTTPELYRPFGFRPLTQHRFSGRLATATSRLAAQPRLLSPIRLEDISLVRSLFKQRHPVSQVFSPCDNEGIFIAMALLQTEWRLSYLHEPEALIVWDIKNGVVRLLDIIAARLPSAGLIAQVLQVSDGSALDILFSPDQIDGQFEPLPHCSDDNTVVMVRGPCLAETRPCMLPLTAVT